MRALERRQAILEVLCERRFEKIDNLASEFNVTRRTIENDVLELSLTYPLFTKTGTYGGVYITDDYYLGKAYLSETQLSVLNKLLPTLDTDDKQVMESIIKKFGRKKLGG